MAGLAIPLEQKRVLSIQSHVVAGYVGNKAASFPMQLLGWEVDAANTVEFSNHTGYGRWGGSKFDAAHLDDIFSALDANGLLRQSHLLTGYVPGAEALLVVARTVERLRTVNPNLVYVLDPVMGDDGRIYVSESVIPIYKSLLPKASCATPNYFEAELLTDIKILDGPSLKLALETFHKRYQIPNVIISAVSLPSSDLARLGLPPLTSSSPSSSTPPRQLLCAGSSIVSAPGEPLQTVTFGIAFPELSEHFEGVGDVFSSLTLARFPSSPNDLSSSSHSISPLAETAELAINTLQAILKKTRERALRLAKGRQELLVPKEGEGVEERIARLRMVELQLVSSQQEIMNPELVFRAVRI